MSNLPIVRAELHKKRDIWTDIFLTHFNRMNNLVSRDAMRLEPLAGKVLASAICMF